MSEDTQIDSFNPNERKAALQELIACTEFPDAGELYNMHCHSFYSYNSEGWSPSHIAFNCAEAGLYAAALCDFDVLDGLEEFLEAGRILGLRAAVHLETRSYVKELSEVDISSPGEPGVAYIMGCGFTTVPSPDSEAGRTLAMLRQGAQDRNLALIARVNEQLPAIAVDYGHDVIPLTPKGVATERHIVRAYRVRASEVFMENSSLADFWAPLLKCSAEEFARFRDDVPKLEELIRNALAKRGGIGYVQPTPETFPPAPDFVKWVKQCDAIPTVTWLDGTSGGEADAEALLDLMTGMGCAALNIIPDRNWNIRDPETARMKQPNLAAIVRGAVAMELPVNIGTEMNKGGLPFVDDITGPVLSAYADVFTRGTDIMVGQSILARYADMPYCGARAAEMFSTVKERNDFYAAVGALPPLTEALAQEYLSAGPERTLRNLCELIAMP